MANGLFFLLMSFFVSCLSISCSRLEVGKANDELAVYEERIYQIFVIDWRVNHGVEFGLDDGVIRHPSQETVTEAMGLWKEMHSKGMYRWYAFNLLPKDHRDIDDISNEIKSIVPRNVSWTIFPEPGGDENIAKSFNGLFSDKQVLEIIEHFFSGDFPE